MTIQTYFPTTNPKSNPDDINVEGYYWLGWSNTKGVSFN
jgi:hypothetical protein